MFILKIAIASVVTFFTFYIVTMWFFSFARHFNIFRNIIRPCEDGRDFPIIGTILAIASILVCFLTWKAIF